MLADGEGGKTEENDLGPGPRLALRRDAERGGT